MANGDEFTDPEWTNDWIQYNIALPMPSQKDKVVLLYSDLKIQEFIGNDSLDFYSRGFYSAVIDLSYHQGLGEMVSRREVLIKKDSLSIGKFTTTKHANGRDWWILVRRAFDSNEYYRLLLSPQGVKNLGKQKVGTKILDGAGQACFSPDGKYYTVAESKYTYLEGTVNIYDFDRCNGLLSNHRQFKVPVPEVGRLAISPNSRYLYVCISTQIAQYDLWAADIEKSKIIVAEHFAATAVPFSASFFSLQLMPDGRIYSTTRSYRNVYHVIQKPNLPGLACRVEQYAIYLPCRNSRSIPNFPNYRLGPIDGSSCDSLGINNVAQAWYRYEKDTIDKLKIEFSDLSFYEPKSWSWDFDDGSPKSTMQNPIHIFPKNGNYKVCLTVSNENGTNTHCKKVNLGTVATNDVKTNHYNQVTPNPFSDRIFVTLNETLASPIIRIFDVQGKEIMRQKIAYGITEIETSTLTAGFYSWIMESKGEIIKTGKMMKM